MSLNAQIALSIVAHESSSSDLASEMRVTPATYGLMLTNGTGANQAQVVWSDSATVPDGNENLRTFASLADDRGSVAITALKVIYFKNTGSLPLTVAPYQWSVGPVASGTQIQVQAGGVLVMVAPTASGWSTAGANAAILIVNGNGVSVSYDMMLVGEGTVS
jgi:hypothetical protein